MKIETYDIWPRQDWRALARRAGWVLLAAVVGQRHHLPLPTILFTLAVDMTVLSVLSFGILTPMLAFAAEGTIEFLLATDATFYALSDWIVRRVIGEAHLLANFLAAFCVEILLVLVAIHFWNAAHMGPRILLWLLRVIQ